MTSVAVTGSEKTPAQTQITTETVWQRHRVAIRRGANLAIILSLATVGLWLLPYVKGPQVIPDLSLYEGLALATGITVGFVAGMKARAKTRLQEASEKLEKAELLHQELVEEAGRIAALKSVDLTYQEDKPTQVVGRLLQTLSTMVGDQVKQMQSVVILAELEMADRMIEERTMRLIQLMTPSDRPAPSLLPNEEPHAKFRDRAPPHLTRPELTEEEAMRRVAQALANEARATHQKLEQLRPEAAVLERMTQVLSWFPLRPNSEATEDVFSQAITFNPADHHATVERLRDARDRAARDRRFKDLVPKFDALLDLALTELSQRFSAQVAAHLATKPPRPTEIQTP
jgi:hypothetical protein